MLPLADDLALVARSADGLKSLLSMVKMHCDKIKMTVSATKSGVISPDDVDWDIVNEAGEVVLGLKTVMDYKYLGIMQHGSISKTGRVKQEQVLKTARRYKGACLKISRMGPDTVALASTCWLTVAIPAILFGTEIIPFNASTIVEVDRISSQLAKCLLGLPLNAANVCAQETLGWRSFCHELYLHQLKFYVRVLHLPEQRWVYKALLEHMTGGWESPYLKYVYKIREEVELLVLPKSRVELVRHLDLHFLGEVNQSIAKLNLPTLEPINSFKKRDFVTEHKESKEISRYRYAAASLGMFWV